MATNAKNTKPLPGATVAAPKQDHTPWPGPAWVQDSVQIWIEDECAPDREKLPAAWKRIFQENLDLKKHESVWDGSDCTFDLMPYGRIAVMAPGGCEIRIVSKEMAALRKEYNEAVRLLKQHGDEIDDIEVAEFVATH